MLRVKETTSARQRPKGNPAAFGNCADCGVHLDDVTDLWCDDCAAKEEHQTLDHFGLANGHRAQIQNLINRGKL